MLSSQLNSCCSTCQTTSKMDQKIVDFENGDNEVYINIIVINYY